MQVKTHFGLNYESRVHGKNESLLYGNFSDPKGNKVYSSLYFMPCPVLSCLSMILFEWHTMQHLKIFNVTNVSCSNGCRCIKNSRTTKLS